MFKLRYLLLLCLTYNILPIRVYAQADSLYNRSFDEKSFEELRNSDTYNYQQEIEPPSNSVLSFLADTLTLLFHFLSTIPGIITLILTIALVVFLAFRSSRARKKKKASIPLPVLSEDVLNEENSLEQLSLSLEQALKENNYKLAIRYNFLIVIKKLDLQKLLKFHLEKTNTQYLKELPEYIKADFSSLSRIFNYTWYGDYPANKEIFMYAKELSHNIYSKSNVA